MPNSNYVRGRKFEYEVRKWLICRNFYVIRAYASKGTFDLVAIPAKNSKIRKTLLIQAKYSRKNKMQVNSEEKTRLAAEARRLQGFCCYAFNENGRIKWKLVDPYYYDRREHIHRQDNRNQDS